MIEYPKEHWENWICRYGLASIQSCKACLFDVLCHLERTEELRKKEEVNKKEKSDLSDNNDK